VLRAGLVPHGAGDATHKEALLDLCARDSFALAAMATLLQGLATNQSLASLSPQALGPLQVLASELALSLAR